MDEGSAVVRGNPGGFFIFGFSHQNLEFRGSEKTKVVLPSNSRTRGYRCDICRLTLVEEETNTEKKAVSVGRKLGRKYAKWRQRNK